MRIFAKLIVGLALVLMACASRTVYVQTEPPPVRVEVAGPLPARNAVWIPGHWSWEGRQHVWVAGYWDRNPQGRLWVPGHWERHHRGWHWVPGHWVR